MTGDWEIGRAAVGAGDGTEPDGAQTETEPEDATTDPAVVFEPWRLGVRLLAMSLQRLDWDESSDAPYFTDKPDWDSYASAQVLAARVELRRDRDARRAARGLVA